MPPCDLVEAVCIIFGVLVSLYFLFVDFMTSTTLCFLFMIFNCWRSSLSASFGFIPDSGAKVVTASVYTPALITGALLNDYCA